METWQRLKEKKKVRRRKLPQTTVSATSPFLSSNPPPPLSSITQGNIKARSLGDLAIVPHPVQKRKLYQDFLLTCTFTHTHTHTSPPALQTCISNSSPPGCVREQDSH